MPVWERVLHVVTVLFVVAGIWTAATVPRDAFPLISRDQVIIQVRYPGAAPEQVERLLLLPIERDLRQVSGLKEIHGIAVEGFAVLIVEIDPDARHPAETIQAIERTVDQVTDLPADLPEPPEMTEASTRTSPVLELAVSGDVDEATLQAEACRLELQLLTLPDVAQVARGGWRQRQIWVEIDPQALTRYQLALTEVSERIRARHVDQPGGEVGAATQRIPLRVSALATTPEAIGAIVLRASERGPVVRVRDVAMVRWDFAETSTLNRARGTRAIHLVILKKTAGDAIRMVDAIQQLLRTTDRHPGIQVSTLRDFSFFIRRRLNVLKANGGIGLALVALVVLLFLSPRTALGAALGIPIAGLMALTFLGWTGATINLITMFGMIMVVGMLVDEDLVIAENIHRHLEAHDDPATAVRNGTREIRRAMIATVLTTIAAFLPLLFLSGITGKFVRWIPVVVIITLAASLLEALFILPNHLHYLATHGRSARNGGTKVVRWFEWLRRAYDRSLARVLRWRWAVIAGAGLLIGHVIYIIVAGQIAYHQFPQRGIEVFFIRGEAEVGTALEQTERLFQPIEALVATLPPTELDTFATQIGMVNNDPNDPFTTRGSHLGQTTIYLTPPQARQRSAQDIIADLRARLGTVPGLREVRFEMIRHGPPVGKPIEIEIRGPEIAQLQVLAERIKTLLGTQPGITDVEDDLEPGKPERIITIDPIAASRSQVTHAVVARAVQQSFKGEVIATIPTIDDQIEIVVRLPEALRHHNSALHAVRIPGAQGRLVPLAAIAQAHEAQGTQVIRHLNHARVLTVNAEIAEDATSVLGVQRALHDQLAPLQAEFPEYTISFSGEAEQTAESLAGLKMAALIAVLLILGILLVTLRSFAMALVVLGTIPLGIIGIIYGFLLEGEHLSFMAMLGLVGMTGIIVDVAIILLDLMRQRMAEGVDFRTALQEAASLRFRPIVLVTLTTIFGIVPTAYGIGGSDPFIQPMALAMNWGLSVGTLLALYWVPCAIMVLDDVRRWVRW